MPGLDSNTKLLLSLDGTDGDVTTTDESDSNHTINFNGTAHLEDTEKKWGATSLQLDGDSDYLSLADSADWDIGTNFTIDLWVKHANHTGNELYVCHHESGEDRWDFQHNDGQAIKFWLKKGNVLRVELSGGEITDTNWYHIAVIKVGSAWGLYKTGTQVAYDSDANTTAFVADLSIGRRAVDNDIYFDGHMDEIRIQHSNYFNAAPADAWGNGETPDTITVPPSSYARDLSINVHDCTDLEDIMVGG